MERQKILIVEDDADISGLLVKIMEGAGYQVRQVFSGTEALFCMERELPDCVLLDLMLPGMTGEAVLDQIRQKQKKEMPVLILSAKVSVQDKVKLLRLGADDYITKPFSAAYLKARIFNLIDQRKKLQALFCASLLPTSIEQQPSEGKEASPALSPNDRKFMDKVMETIEKHLDNGDLMVEDIANEVNMSRSVFFKKLKTLTGLSPVEFLKEIRMKRAAQLIETDEYSMAQIAYMVGLNDSHYFSKCFKQQYGITPTEYKESRKPNMD